MSDDLLAKLKALQKQRGDISPFATHNEFLAWADDVVPLLSFNEPLQNQFKSATRAANTNRSFEVPSGVLDNINSCIGLLNQAVMSREVKPVLNQPADTAKSELKPSKFKQWLLKVGEKILIALVVGAIGYLALHYLAPLIS